MDDLAAWLRHRRALGCRISRASAMVRALGFGSASCCVLGAAATVWVAFQIWHGADLASPSQSLVQSRPEFLAASQSQTAIRRMAQRMIMR
jgi:hypothetical protein